MPKTTELKAGIDPHKRTTKVNIFVVIGVIAFFALGAFVVRHLAKNPPQTQEETTPLK